MRELRNSALLTQVILLPKFKASIQLRFRCEMIDPKRIIISEFNVSNLVNKFLKEIADFEGKINPFVISMD